MKIDLKETKMSIKEMSIVKFENVKITTMTVVVNLQGNVVMEAAFSLLPITKLNLPKNAITTKKFKIPWPGPQHAGKIFSSKFGGMTRGLIKTNKPKSFRNSVGLDICTSVKNISAKLSKNKVHMCGPNSEALAIETVSHIINHLKRIQEELDFANAHIEERDEVISWLLKETKGDHFIINEDTQEIIILEEGEIIRNNVIYDKAGNVKYNYREIPFKWEEGDIINAENIIVNKYGQPYYRSLTKKEIREGVVVYPIMQMDDAMRIQHNTDRIPVDEKGAKFHKVMRVPLRVLDVTSVKLPSCVTKSTGNFFPKGINPRIANFLLSYIQDYAYHHVFSDFLEVFKTIQHVYTEMEEPIEKEGGNKGEVIVVGMEKKEVATRKLPLIVGKLNIAMINYSFSLGMNIDKWQLCQLIDGYKDFKATYNNTTDHHVTVTVPYTADEDEIIKRKDSRAVSFMCYQSGIVTQSGPSPKIMEPIYYEFMKFIRENHDKIVLRDGKSFTLKFKRFTNSAE
jgi:hypothetical protein